MIKPFAFFGPFATLPLSLSPSCLPLPHQHTLVRTRMFMGSDGLLCVWNPAKGCTPSRPASSLASKRSETARQRDVDRLMDKDPEDAIVSCVQFLFRLSEMFRVLLLDGPCVCALHTSFPGS